MSSGPESIVGKEVELKRRIPFLSNRCLVLRRVDAGENIGKYVLQDALSGRVETVEREAFDVADGDPKPRF